MTDTSVATINQPPLVVLRERLIARRGELKAALPSDIDPDHFIRVLTTAAEINPDLLAVPWRTLWINCMKACRDGLLPDGKEGAIVPFKSNAQWIPMYQGYIKKFRQSGMFKWITADVVRAGEEFSHWVDETGEHFKHVPGDDATVPVVKVYAAALTKDGAFSVAVMAMAEIDKIKKMSRASRDDAPWKVWPEEMMKKTAIRRLAKFLPSGPSAIPEDDDDLPVLNAPPIAIRATHENTGEPVRRPGATAALDQFARNPDAPPSGGPASPDTTNPAEETGGGVVNSEASAEGVADDPAAIPSDELAEAYERGKDAKAQGFQRKAMPPEYRDDAHARHSMAWTCGFDGKPVPEWSAS